MGGREKERTSLDKGESCRHQRTVERTERRELAERGWLRAAIKEITSSYHARLPTGFGFTRAGHASLREAAHIYSQHTAFIADDARAWRTCAPSSQPSVVGIGPGAYGRAREADSHVGDDAVVHHGLKPRFGRHLVFFCIQSLSRPLRSVSLYLPSYPLWSLEEEVLSTMIRSALASAARPVLNAVCDSLSWHRPVTDQPFSARGRRPPSPLASPRSPRGCVAHLTPSWWRAHRANVTCPAAHQVWRCLHCAFRCQRATSA